MPKPSHPSRGVRLTLGWMLRLVALSALMLAFATPFVRTTLGRERGSVAYLQLAGVLTLGLPIIAVCGIAILYPSSPARDWTLRALFAAAVTLWMCAGLVFTLGSLALPGRNATFFWLELGGLAVFAVPWIKLLARSEVGRCPACRRPTLLPDRHPNPLGGRGSERAWCAACGTWAWRTRSGPWQTHPPDPTD